MFHLGGEAKNTPRCRCQPSASARAHTPQKHQHQARAHTRINAHLPASAARSRRPCFGSAARSCRPRGRRRRAPCPCRRRRAPRKSRRRAGCGCFVFSVEIHVRQSLPCRHTLKHTSTSPTHPRAYAPQTKKQQHAPVEKGQRVAQPGDVEVAVERAEAHPGHRLDGADLAPRRRRPVGRRPLVAFFVFRFLVLFVARVCVVCVCDVAAKEGVTRMQRSISAAKIIVIITINIIHHRSHPRP